MVNDNESEEEVVLGSSGMNKGGAVEKQKEGVAMSELKPCPFCGNNDLGFLPKNNYVSVGCTKCFARGGLGENAEKAAELWNTRSPSEERLREAIEPSEIIQAVRDASFYNEPADPRIFYVNLETLRNLLDVRFQQFLQSQKGRK